MIGDERFHPDTRALLAFGRALAGQPAPPKRQGADHVLERLLILERCADGRWPLRSFGAELTALFGRDLKDQDFASLWLEPDWALVTALAGAALAAEEPGIARAKAETACGRLLGLEILITPLKVEAAFGERYLGMLQPLGGEAFLEGRPLVRLRLVSLHPPPAKTPPRVRLVVTNP
jgi:hypothetical protein